MSDPASFRETNWAGGFYELLRLYSRCRTDWRLVVRCGITRGMRYPQGGGLTAEHQQFREWLRLQAAEQFAQGEASAVIAKDLRVNLRSVQRWRQTWNEGGPRALRSQGPASLPRLSQKQFTQLEAKLAMGPAAHGWEDQRWTLNRVKTVIGWRFHLAYTIQGVRKLLVRNGWSCQVPARRAMERDDDAVAGWFKEV